MENEESIVGNRIKRLLHTPAESMGEIIEGCGEAFWIYLIAELDSGEMIQIGESGWEPFHGRVDDLQALTRVDTGMGDIEPRYSVNDIEGQKIVSTRTQEGDFALVLENGLCLSCPGTPWGNGPFVYRDDGADDGVSGTRDVKDSSGEELGGS